MNDWQDISTLRGDPFVLTWDGHEVNLARRQLYESGRVYWWPKADGHDVEPLEREPTHWMPEPIPPIL